MSWREELVRREALATSQVEQLRNRISELAKQLDAAEQLLTRLVITRETMADIFTDTEPAGESVGEKPAPEPILDVVVPKQVSPIGAVSVPPWSPGLDPGVLPGDYEEMLAVLAEADHGLRAGQVATAVGIDISDRSLVEGLRSKLKRLVARGWAQQAPSGVFMIADQVGAQGD